MSIQSSEVIRLDLPATHKHLNILGACISELLIRVENIDEREAIIYNLQLAAGGQSLVACEALVI